RQLTGLRQYKKYMGMPAQHGANRRIRMLLQLREHEYPLIWQDRPNYNRSLTRSRETPMRSPIITLAVFALLALAAAVRAQEIVTVSTRDGVAQSFLLTIPADG